MGCDSKNEWGIRHTEPTELLARVMKLDRWQNRTSLDIICPLTEGTYAILKEDCYGYTSTGSLLVSNLLKKQIVKKLCDIANNPISSLGFFRLHLRYTLLTHLLTYLTKSNLGSWLRIILHTNSDHNPSLSIHFLLWFSSLFSTVLNADA